MATTIAEVESKFGGGAPVPASVVFMNGTEGQWAPFGFRDPLFVERTWG